MFIYRFVSKERATWGKTHDIQAVLVTLAFVVKKAYLKAIPVEMCVSGQVVQWPSYSWKDLEYLTSQIRYMDATWAAAIQI